MNENWQLFNNLKEILRFVESILRIMSKFSPKFRENIENLGHIHLNGDKQNFERIFFFTKLNFNKN